MKQGSKRRVFSVDDKARIVSAIIERADGVTVESAAEAQGVHTSHYHNWMKNKPVMARVRRLQSGKNGAANGGLNGSSKGASRKSAFNTRASIVVAGEPVEERQDIGTLDGSAFRKVIDYDALERRLVDAEAENRALRSEIKSLVKFI